MIPSAGVETLSEGEQTSEADVREYLERCVSEEIERRRAALVSRETATGEGDFEEFVRIRISKAIAKARLAMSTTATETSPFDELLQV